MRWFEMPKGPVTEPKKQPPDSLKNDRIKKIERD
jgi:hypothetical protein